MLWLAGPVTTELSHRAPDQNPNTKMGFTAGAHGAPDHSRITNCGRFPLRRPSQLRDTSPAAANVTTPTWLAILLSCSSSRTEQGDRQIATPLKPATRRSRFACFDGGPDGYMGEAPEVARHSLDSVRCGGAPFGSRELCRSQ